MAELFPNLVTRVEINDTVLPYSSEEAIFNSSVIETLTFDVKPKFGDTVYKDLIENSNSGSTYQTGTTELLNSGLKLAVMYYVVARTLRKTVTPTRFGSTVKVNSELTSEPAQNSAIVTQSNYYKQMADDLVKELLTTWQPAELGQQYSNKCRIIGY